MSEELLEYIANKCNLYISNLRLSTSKEIILPVVKSLESNMFSADDWSRSLSYIFEKPLRFNTPASAKKYYIKELLISLSYNSNEQNT